MKLDERMFKLNRQLSIMIAMKKYILTEEELMYFNHEIAEWIKIYRKENEEKK